jgi:hypothetical protein
MPSHKKNTLLKNAEANAIGNFFKRVFFSATQDFFCQRFFLIKSFSQRTGFVRNRTDTVSNVNRFKKYKLTNEEIEFIEEMIKPM